MDEDVVYIHIHRYTQWNITQSLKKNEIRPFAATWTDMEITKVSEVSQARGERKGIICIHTHTHTHTHIHTHSRILLSHKKVMK